MSYLRTKNLEKKYGNQRVVKNLKLHTKKGEVYGFIGKNGAGKTTTINMILSLIRKTSGSVIIDDEEIKFIDVDYKRDIGYVPDVPVFPNHLNNEEYLKFVCDVFKIPSIKSKEKINEVLEFVGLPKSSKKLSTYSRGMKQRLAIAQALIHDPKLIIMDEPTSALDPIGRKDVMDIILKLKGEKTIFYSTHILDDVEKVCSRIGLLDNGTLILEDDISAIQERYFKENVYIEAKLEKNVLYHMIEKAGLSENIEVFDNGILCKKNGYNYGPKILKYLTDENIPLIKYEEIRPSLEDVFMEVTK